MSLLCSRPNAYGEPAEGSSFRSVLGLANTPVVTCPRILPYLGSTPCGDHLSDLPASVRLPREYLGRDPERRHTPSQPLGVGLGAPRELTASCPDVLPSLRLLTARVRYVWERRLNQRKGLITYCRRRQGV